MKKILFYLIFLCVTLSFSQSRVFEISGTLVSGDEKLPLESASVYIERIKDSTLVSYTITDKNGFFTLKGKTTDSKLNLFISYVGYQTYLKTIRIDKTEISLNTTTLQVDNNALDRVFITSRAPVTIKKDTLEFNVKSFKTKKDANVEDLLKKLPFVVVSANGSIKVNGKPVNKILVNGKSFFSNDPTIATRNLSKDIIETVQVVDTKTKSQEFSGEAGDKENKTINLVIKKENNKGVFGRASIGAGTDKRYGFSGMFNRFDDDQRFSVLFGGNNTNSPGFSAMEIGKIYGMRGFSLSENGSFKVGGRSFGGGSGIITSKNIGTNFVDKIRDKVDLSTDYFYSESSSDNVASIQRENILPNSRYFTNSESKSFSDNDNHSVNIGLDIKVNPTLLVNIVPTFRHTKSKSVFSREEVSKDELNTLSNESNMKSTAESFGKSFSNKIEVTKRFGSKGAFLKLKIGNEISNKESDDFLFSKTNIYGDNPNEVIRDQFTKGDNKVNSLNTSINYNVPLTKKTSLIFGYTSNRNKQENKQSTLDKDVNEAYTVFNADLSTNFEYIEEAFTPAFSINYRGKKWSTKFSMDYLHKNLENRDLLRPQFNIKRKFKSIGLSSNLGYSFNVGTNISIDYVLSNTPPELEQLQAFQNISDPLNTVTGNPDLKQVNNHAIYLTYSTMDYQKNKHFSSFLEVNFIDNQVVSNTTTDENLIRETTYSNVKGNYRVSGLLEYSKMFKPDSLKVLRCTFGMEGNMNRNINYNNSVQYASDIVTISPYVWCAFGWRGVMSIMPRYQINFTKNTFDIDSFEDREFLYHSFSLRTKSSFPKHFELRNEVQYNYNPNIAEGFQKSSWFWNATLAHSLMKDKASLTLKVYDLLNQNTNARRTTNQNFIQDSQSTVLQQYFMLSFSWKFNSLGKVGELRI